jgi:3-hydroxybutyryl-CoA dehydrogenase
MNILVIADEIRRLEFQEKLSTLSVQQVAYAEAGKEITTAEMQPYEVIIDLSFNGDMEAIQQYALLQNRVIILHTVTHSLLQYHAIITASKSIFVGINALPSFINLPKAEICIHKTAHKAIIQKVFEQLNWAYEIVENRVGMLTPRVVCMIINEAYYTLQEKTATQADIDTSMKLGTNYPFGPFEWAKKIGIQHVYNVLSAIYNDTKDERYKVCPMLKTMTLIE